jgi:hypothetical protein
LVFSDVIPDPILNISYKLTGDSPFLLVYDPTVIFVNVLIKSNGDLGQITISELTIILT